MNNSSDKKIGKVSPAQTKFIWHIENILEYCELPKIKSPTFTMKTGDVLTRWILSIHGGDKESQDSENDEEFLWIYLMSLNQQDIRATIHFCMLGVTNKELYCRQIEASEFKPGEGWGIKFIPRFWLFAIHCKSCTIVCTITTNELIKIEIEKCKDNAVKSLRLSEFDGLGGLLNDKRYSDVVVVVEGTEIYAHKNFLATKSPVFEAMFTHNMTESNNNRLEISDISYKTVMGMLKYIYTGIVPNYTSTPPSDSLYKELLIAAEKYDIQHLKDECQKILSTCLEIDNVFEYLNFADKYNSYLLKRNVIDFIVNHGEDIAALPSFNKHCNELNSDVYSEVFRALVTKRRKVE